MPKLQKSFELVITPEQFLNACSLLELKEVELLLDSYLRKAEHDARRKAYREGADPQEVEYLEAEEVDAKIMVDEQGREWYPILNWMAKKG